MAPEEMPRMNGPAMGLLKNVCRRNPERDSAPPRMAAMAIRGRRMDQMMSYVTFSPCRRKITFNISGMEIFTDPVLMFRMTIATKITAIATKVAIYLSSLFRRFSAISRSCSVLSMGYGSFLPGRQLPVMRVCR